MLPIAVNHELLDKLLEIAGDFGREIGIGLQDIVEHPAHGLIAAAVLTGFGLFLRSS
jgi:hypothetical protein